MNEVRQPEKAEALFGLAGPFAQTSWNATHQFFDKGQSFVKMMTEWNTEVSHFLSHRFARNDETVGRMTKCQSLPEIFAIQSQWVQDAADDYLKETSKLIDVNSKAVGNLMGSVEQTEARSSPANASMRAAS